jgi:hypothetical protein
MNQKNVKRLASFYINKNSSRASIYVTNYLSITKREAISTANLFSFHHSFKDIMCSPYRYHLTLVKNYSFYQGNLKIAKTIFQQVGWMEDSVSTYI